MIFNMMCEAIMTCEFSFCHRPAALRCSNCQRTVCVKHAIECEACGKILCSTCEGLGLNGSEPCHTKKPANKRSFAGVPMGTGR